MEVESIPSVSGYSEIIQVNVPIRFYFLDNEFDGIEFGEFKNVLMPWQLEMVERCLKAVGESIGEHIPS